MMYALANDGKAGRPTGVRGWRVEFSAPAEAALSANGIGQAPSGYGAEQGANGVALGLILAAHAALLFALIQSDVVHVTRERPRPLVVELLTLAPPPPPAALPEPEVKPPEPIKPPIVAPPPIIRVAAPPISITTVREAPPVRAVIVAPAPAVPAGPVIVGDLSTKMISRTPPRYPIQSRRQKEQGTVFLTVLLNADGSVAEVGIARSSGFVRLDKAALEAVRRWRWSPTIRDGVAVMVHGIVDIPFILA